MLTLYVLILLMVLGWAGNFLVLKKLALSEFPPFAVVFLRVWISATLLSAIYFLSPASRRQRFARGDWKRFAELGLYGVALNQAGFTLGLNYTSVAHSSLLIALGPIFVLLLARWQGLEALTRRKLLGMGLSVIGIVILTREYGSGSGNPTLAGDVLTLAGSLAFALYTVAGKKVALTYNTLALNTCAYLTGAAFILPLTAWQLPQVPWSQITWRGWLGLAYVAGVASVLAYLIYYYALSKLSASRVAAFSYVQPPLAILLAGFLFPESEPLTPTLLAGGAAVLVGVYFAERAGPNAGGGAERWPEK